MPALREAVLEYIDAVTRVGICVCAALSHALGLGSSYFDEHLLAPEPIQLFRAFRYKGSGSPDRYGIGEHTDFGLLTLLQQFAPGLQVRHSPATQLTRAQCRDPENKWVDIPVIPGALVCNGAPRLRALI